MAHIPTIEKARIILRSEIATYWSVLEHVRKYVRNKFVEINHKYTCSMWFGIPILKAKSSLNYFVLTFET